MTLRTPPWNVTRWTMLGWLCSGCLGQPEPIGIDSATTGSPDSDSNSDSGSGSPTTSSSDSGPLDPDAYCAQFATQETCTWTDEDGPYCTWEAVVPVSMENGACLVDEPQWSCQAMTGATSAAGCGQQPDGCTSDLFYARVGDRVEVSEQCGGSPIVGFEPCTYIEPGVYDPPECGCVCTGLPVGFCESTLPPVHSIGSEVDDRILRAAGIGDFDGDGSSDLVLAAPGSYQGTEGRAWVVLGGQVPDPLPETVEGLTQGPGVLEVVAEAATDHPGGEVHGIGDFDGDGLDDFLLEDRPACGQRDPNFDCQNIDPHAPWPPECEPVCEGRDTGSVIVFGRSDHGAIRMVDLYENQGGTVLRRSAAEALDWRTMAHLDLDQDGRDDLVFGGYDDLEPEVTVVFGHRPGEPIALDGVGGGVLGVRLLPSELNDVDFGGTVAAAGDPNGDGIADLLVSDVSYDSYEGRVYLVFGPGPTADVELDALVESGGALAFDGTTEPIGTRADPGASTAGVGDMDGDGYDDLAILAPSYISDPYAANDHGRLYIVRGGPQLQSLALADLHAPSEAGTFVRSGSWHFSSGAPLAAPGDLNGDGLADLITVALEELVVVLGGPLDQPLALDQPSRMALFDPRPDPSAQDHGLRPTSVLGDVDCDGTSELWLWLADARVNLMFEPTLR